MINPLEAKIAAPYARALYDYSNSQNVTHQVTGDFQNLEVFLKKADNLVDFLNNPIMSAEAKSELITKVLKSQLNDVTLKFLLILVSRNRINLLQSIIDNYLAFDKNSKVACETLVTTNLVVLAGEIKSKSNINETQIAREVIEKVGYTEPEYLFDFKSCDVKSYLHEQSP